jgi:GrpB-like predicted nucleotidyltransferase (UPF0157 family)
MMIDHSVLSDALNGYLDGKVVERGFWQSLDQEARTWLSRAILGAKRKSVEVRISDYQEQWPKQFSSIERELREKVGSLVLSIEHIGSTAVPGLAAKPIIDIDVAIASADKFSAVKERLEQFGYIHRGPCGVPDREAFRCVIDLPGHHLYVCETDACSIREQLRFRNALRRNPELVAEYAELKRALADRYRHDRNAYTEAKTGFIRSVLESYRIN